MLNFFTRVCSDVFHTDQVHRNWDSASSPAMRKALLNFAFSEFKFAIIKLSFERF